MTSPSTPLVLALSIALSGCVPIPYRDARTPAASGRVIDSRSQMPLAGAEVRVLDDAGAPLARPRATADPSGSFSLPRTYNYHAGARLAAHAVEGLPAGSESHRLRISASGHGPRIIDLDAFGQAHGLRDNFYQNAQSRFHSLSYDGTIQLGDITLQR